MDCRLSGSELMLAEDKLNLSFLLQTHYTPETRKQ